MKDCNLRNLIVRKKIEYSIWYSKYTSVFELKSYKNHHKNTNKFKRTMKWGKIKAMSIIEESSVHADGLKVKTAKMN